jgi:hypothetical protein
MTDISQPELIKYTPAFADAEYERLGGDEAVIPDGPYCYTALEWSTTDDGIPVLRTKLCPYWAIDEAHERQDNGYCAKLKSGDWEDGWGLLFDQVKACSVRDDIPDDEEWSA